jgi:acetyl-CoA synthetase
MAWPVIEKPQGNWRVQPNLLSYERTCAEYSWQKTEQEFIIRDRGLNIAYECVAVTRKVPARSSRLRWLGKQGEVRDFSYVDLQWLSNRFANVLRGLGIGKGDRVFALAGRIPDLHRRAGRAEKWQRLLSFVFSVRT